MTYKAINARYKTSLNNDSFTEFVVTIRSVAGENELVKFNDINNILPETAGIIAGRVAENGETYKKAAAAMKSVADNFEVYSVELLDGNGDPIFLSGKIELLFRADDYFDRTKAEVYFMDDNGAIARLSASGYGRYVAAKTSNTGAFIVCVPGVAFRMPMWGYAVIAAGALVVIAGVIVAIVVTVKRKKKNA